MKSVTGKEQDAKLPEEKKPSASSPSQPRRRLPRWLLICLSIIAILLVAGGGYLVFMPHVKPLSLPKLPRNLTMSDLGIENWQQLRQALPEKPLDNPQLPATPTVDPNLAAIQHAAGLALTQQGQLDRGIAYLQAAVESDPNNLLYGNDYRIVLRDHQRYNDEEQFYDALYKKHNDIPVGIGLALSYVDQMRSCPKPPDGLVCQAQYSSRSISLLDSLLSAQPYNVIARYARGLNHLYWPTLMGHLPTAQTDLEYAVALTTLMKTSSPAFIDDAYAALGDVFGKDKHVDDAINIWRNGLLAAPGSSLLQSRLDLSRDKIVDEMNGPIRGLGVYVDTDITLFWT